MLKFKSTKLPPSKNIVIDTLLKVMISFYFFSKSVVDISLVSINIIIKKSLKGEYLKLNTLCLRSTFSVLIIKLVSIKKNTLSNIHHATI